MDRFGQSNLLDHLDREDSYFRFFCTHISQISHNTMTPTVLLSELCAKNVKREPSYGLGDENFNSVSQELLLTKYHRVDLCAIWRFYQRSGGME